MFQNWLKCGTIQWHFANPAEIWPEFCLEPYLQSCWISTGARAKIWFTLVIAEVCILWALSVVLAAGVSLCAFWVSRWSVSSSHIGARDQDKVSCSGKQPVPTANGHCNGTTKWQHCYAAASTLPATTGSAPFQLARRRVWRRPRRWLWNWTVGPESHSSVRCCVELVDNYI